MGRHKHQKKNYFMKGHAGYPRKQEYLDIEPKRITRLDKHKFSRVAKISSGGIPYAPDAEGQSAPVTLLRPKVDKHHKDICEEYATGQDEGQAEMRLINIQKYTHLWNTAIAEHSLTACVNPNFTTDRELKWGLGWKQSLKCTHCTYKSALFKLYDEAPQQGRGTRSAACNIGLQVGLQDTSIGNTRARMLIASTNTPPPSLSAMQRLSSRVSTDIVKLNTRDMRAKREQMKETNTLRGLSATSPINISIDVRYNSTTITSRHKMGQNASQAIGVAVEHQTDQKQIVACHLVNKLCTVGSWLRNRGFNVQCPEHPDCTANLLETDPISEKDIGEAIGEDLIRDEILVRYVATDGDARSADGVAIGIAKHVKDWEVSRQADTTHLGQSQFRHTVRASFSPGMFPGLNAERRKEQQKMLGLDIKNRCHCILAELYRKYAGNIYTIAKKMPKVIDTTLACYGGDCNQCRHHGIVCNGGKRKNWWTRSWYLSKCGLHHLNMEPDDHQILRALLLLRLGVASLRLTKQNMNTNKNEAINRGLSVNLPKNVNYSRNAAGRMHSTIHRLNHGAGNSLIQKLEYVQCPISKGGQVARAVKQMQVLSKYHTMKLRQNIDKRQKLANKLRRIRAYITAKYRKRIKPDHMYKKGQLDPDMHRTDRDKSSSSNYNLRKRVGRQRSHVEHPYFKPLHYI